MNTMKTKEELNVLKEEIESVNEKLHELTPEELELVTGGLAHGSEHAVAPVLATKGSFIE